MSFFDKKPKASEHNELLFKIYGLLNAATIEDDSPLNAYGVRTTLDRENNTIEVRFPGVPVVNPAEIPLADTKDYYTVKYSVNPTTGYLESKSRAETIQLLAQNCPKVLETILDTCEEGRVFSAAAAEKKSDNKSSP